MIIPVTHPIRATKNSALLPDWQRRHVVDPTVGEARSDRSRLGRLDSLDPHRLPLRRDGEAADTSDYVAPADRVEDDLRAVKGIALAPLLSAPFWVLIAWWIW